MNDGWREAIRTRLETRLRASGSCAYSARAAAAAEPTAIAAVALARCDGDHALVGSALDWLMSEQRRGGEVGSTPASDAPGWPTALALWAWQSAPAALRDRYVAAGRAALAWLVRSSGRPMRRSTTVETHDTELVGWSWVSGTHSWVEPTAYALLALRAAGAGDHARARDGVRLLLDRAIPGGGWNYGNRELFGSQLHAFPESTGVALAALAGEPPCVATREAIAFLNRELPRIRSPLSVGWGVFGLRAWGAAPPESERWLDETAAGVLDRSENDAHFALLLLAGSGQSLLESSDAA